MKEDTITLGSNMIKRKSDISINVLTALVILFSILLLSVGVGNAWFSYNLDNGLYLIVKVGEFNVSLYQVEGQNSTQVFTNSKNSTEANPSYIVFNEMVVPEAVNELQLDLKNEDAGVTVLMRFKFQLYACDGVTDVLIPTTLDLGNDFVYRADGYNYYVDENKNNKIFLNNERITLFTGFIVGTEDFNKYENGATVKIVLTVECVDSSLGF